jgi:hypothetical protein
MDHGHAAQCMRQTLKGLTHSLTNGYAAARKCRREGMKGDEEWASRTTCAPQPPPGRSRCDRANEQTSKQTWEPELPTYLSIQLSRPANQPPTRWASTWRAAPLPTSDSSARMPLHPESAPTPPADPAARIALHPTHSVSRSTRLEVIERYRIPIL